MPRRWVLSSAERDGLLALPEHQDDLLALHVQRDRSIHHPTDLASISRTQSHAAIKERSNLFGAW